jgi:L-threonylcarbamoyladenylate synthase
VQTAILPPTPAGIARAAELIRAGELVAFPTETVYGLGGDALNPAAVAKIFVAKGRPAEDPLIIHIAAVAELAQVAVDIPAHAALLAEHCWPGPLTLILPRGPAVPLSVSAGRDTVAVRVPALPIALELITAAATPIAAPSANRFGHTSPTTATHVLHDLDGRIAAVIDGGATPIGVESTVLDLTTAPPTLLRPGGVSLEALRDLLGAVQVGERAPAAPGVGLVAPGLLDRHYAPETPLWLVIGPPAAARAWLAEQISRYTADGLRVGLLAPEEDLALLAGPGVEPAPLGPVAAPETIAQNLYAALRALDARRPDVILARDIGATGIARAVRDRLTRAAAGRVVRLGTVE